VAGVLKQLASGSPDKIMVMGLMEGSQNRRQQLWAIADPPHIVVGNVRYMYTVLASSYMLFVIALIALDYSHHLSYLHYSFIFLIHISLLGNPRALQKLVDVGRLRLNSVSVVVVDEVDACLISSETR
jgi:hypothetical protein